MTEFASRRGLVMVLGAFAAAIAGIPRLIGKLFDRKAGDTQWIEPETLARAIDNKAGWIILDVRNPDEFSGPVGHIPDARNIPVDQIAATPSEFGLPRKGQIVMVCLTDKRSERAAKALHAAGFSQIFVLRGGMQRWNAEQRPVAQATLQA